MNNSIKISIIMPNYNGDKFIEESINSFIKNAYLNKELIIVDAKSNDESHEIIEKYAKEFDNIKWINTLDTGISDAINIGLKNITGDIVGYLGSDDILNKETLFKVNDYMNLINADAIYFDSYTYYMEKNIIELRKCPNVPFSRKNLIKYGTIVGLQNIFFNKKVFENIKYNIDNKYSMDYEVYFSIIKKYTNFLYVEYPATINKFHNNISNKLSIIQTKEALQVMKKNVEILDFKYLPYKRIIKSIISK